MAAALRPGGKEYHRWRASTKKLVRDLFFKEDKKKSEHQKLVNQKKK